LFADPEPRPARHDVRLEDVHIRNAPGIEARRIPDTSVNQRAKNYHWGDFTTGLFEAKDRDFDSVLLLNHDDTLAEGPGFNVFIVKGETVITPDWHCLHGITRRTALEIAGELGLSVEERGVPLDEALNADEIFVTTSGGGPVPVTALDERVFSNGAPGPVASRIRERYWDWMTRPEHLSPIDYGQMAAE
ncbi:MAG: aminotransferase class IV, partial [Pseudomonadota bacterium]